MKLSKMILRKKIGLYLMFSMIILSFLRLPNSCFTQPPKKVKGGIEFSCKDAKAQSVYLAGSFNNWAENSEGKVSRPEFLMQKGKDGVWKKVISLNGGKHTYKFVINGSEWIADPFVKETDKDGNSVLIVEGPSTDRPSVVSSGKSDSSPKEISGGVKFTYKGQADKVTVAGEFNKWNMEATPMKQEKPGVWSVVVPLPAGEHPYKFIVDGQWMQDPSNPSTSKEGEFDNSIVKVTKGAAAPVVTGPKKVKGGWEFSFNAPTAQSVHLAGNFNNWADNQNGSVANSAHLMSKGADGVWRKIVPLNPGQYSYKFVVDGNQWSPDPNNSAPRDKDDNSIFIAK